MRWSPTPTAVALGVLFLAVGVFALRHRRTAVAFLTAPVPKHDATRPMTEKITLVILIIWTLMSGAFAIGGIIYVLT